MKKIFRSYNILAAAALLCFAAALVFTQKWADVHVHDTYYVFRFSAVFFAAAFFLLLLAVLYYFAGKLPGLLRAVKIHLAVSLLLVFTLVALLLLASRAYTPGFSNWRFFENNNTLIIINCLLLIAVQVLFLGAVLWKVIRKRTGH
jgi:hypothetical protein